VTRSHERLRAWREARNVLCVRLDSLGDVLMTGPAMRALRFANPHRRITLLSSRAGIAAAALMPEVDAAIRYDAPWMKGALPLPTRDLEMRDTLAEGRYDAAVIFTVYSQSPLPAALLCHLADIPLRVAHCRENPYGLLTDWVPETEPEQAVRHEVQRQLDLVRAVGASTIHSNMRIAVPAHARAAVDDRIALAGIAHATPLLVLHPGASAASRRYPADRFAHVARELLAAWDGHIVVTGGAEEAALVDTVVGPSAGTGRIHGVAGHLDLPELAALIERAHLLISNNSGPVHVAACVGTPVVDLYALTNPQHTPWNVPHRVLFRDVPCRYCYKSVCPHGHNLCLAGVGAGEVVAAALALLNGAPASAEAGAVPATSPARANAAAAHSH